jgi:hypothetical protein
MTDSLRNRLRDGLKSHYGAMTRLVEATKTLKEGGYSRYYVYLVLNGERENTRVLSLAADILAETVSSKRAQAKALSLKIEQLEAASAL